MKPMKVYITIRNARSGEVLYWRELERGEKPDPYKFARMAARHFGWRRASLTYEFADIHIEFRHSKDDSERPLFKTWKFYFVN